MPTDHRLIDIIIPIIKEDFSVLKQNIPQIFKYLPVRNIILIGSNELKDSIDHIQNVQFLDENELYPNLSISEVQRIKNQISGNTRRSGWYFQQFLKMAYSSVCKEDYYLIWDADTIPLRDIALFDSANKPYLSQIEYSKYDESYYRTLSNLLPNEKLYKKVRVSFITEHMVIKKNIMEKLIFEIESNNLLEGSYFFEKILHAIHIADINLSGFSEFETYANYVLNVYPHSYTLREWKNLRHGKIFFGSNPSPKQIDWAGRDFSVMSIEKFDFKWLLISPFVSNWSIKSSDFITYYKFFATIISTYMSFRMWLRQKIKQ